MRVVTYIGKNQFDKIMSQDCTIINGSDVVFGVRYNWYNGVDIDGSYIWCIAGGPDKRNMSFKTVVEFLPGRVLKKYGEECKYYLFELEIPEEEILQMRIKDVAAWTSLGEDCGHPRVHEQVRDNKLNWLRQYYHDKPYDVKEAAWAVVPYVKREWVVSVRSFTYSFNIWDDGSQYCDIVYINYSMFPIWNDTIVLGPNHQMAISDARNDSWGPYINGKRTDPKKRKTYMLLKKYQEDTGMYGCPGYFTVDEAMDCCSRATKDKITNRLTELRMNSKPKENILIRDIFGGDLIRVYDIAEDKIRLLKDVFTPNSTRADILNMYDAEALKTIYKYIFNEDCQRDNPETIVDILFYTARIHTT